MLPWKRADDALTADPDTESILLDDALDSFASERPVTRAMVTIRTAVTNAVLSVGSFRSINARNYLLVGTASIACILLGLLLVGRIVGGPEAEQAAVSSSVSASTLAATSPDARKMPPVKEREQPSPVGRTADQATGFGWRCSWRATGKQD